MYLMAPDLKVGCEIADTIDVVSKVNQNIVTQSLVLSYTANKQVWVKSALVPCKHSGVQPHSK